MASGLMIWEHNASRKCPKNCLPIVDIRLILNFLVNYTKTIFLPGRIPGYNSSDIQLLPFSTTKKVQCKHLYFTYDIPSTDGLGTIPSFTC